MIQTTIEVQLKALQNIADIIKTKEDAEKFLIDAGIIKKKVGKLKQDIKKN